MKEQWLEPKGITRRAGRDESAHVPCACAVSGGGRKAVAVDSEIKQSNLKRLRRIEGQIRGLHKMVEDERYCADIIVQIASLLLLSRLQEEVRLQPGTLHAEVGRCGQRHPPDDQADAKGNVMNERVS